MAQNVAFLIKSKWELNLVPLKLVKAGVVKTIALLPVELHESTIVLNVTLCSVNILGADTRISKIAVCGNRSSKKRIKQGQIYGAYLKKS